MGVMIRDVDFLAQLVINTVLNRHEHSRASLPKAGARPLLSGWLRPLVTIKVFNRNHSLS